MADIIVKTEQGSLRGIKSTNYKHGVFYSFYGIPYALPPVAELRFKAPQPPKPWLGIKDATHEKDGCISRNTLTGKTEGSEDSLYLNVYTQQLTENPNQKLKPVMVWIHGGAYSTGTTKTELYGPDYLLTQDIVLVTVNYRLGALGFLCLEDPTLGVTGNNAFRDIIMALKWIQRNIKSFLGDSSNVTLFGESSGAVTAHYLMVSPLAKGLFHKIILQSGCALHHWSEGRRDSAKRMAEVFGLSTNSEKEILEFLKKQPVEKLFEAQEKMKVEVSPHLKRHFYPVIEKTSTLEPPVIAEDPLKLILSGNYHKVPMIIGFTSDEGMFFDFLLRKQTKTDTNSIIITDFEKLVPHHLKFPQGSPMSKYLAKEIKKFYFNDEEPTLKHRKQFYDVQSDASFNYLLSAVAIMHLKNLGFPIYFFRFSFDGKHNIYKRIHKADFAGASHSDDVCYLFKMLPVEKIIKESPEDITIERMTKLWTNFARNGDPNVREYDKNVNVEWKEIEDGKIHCLNIGNELSLLLNPDKERFKFWDDIYRLHPLLNKL